MSLVGRAPSTLSETTAQYHCPPGASFVCQPNETQHSTSSVFPGRLFYSLAPGQVSFKKEVGVMVIDLVFWLTVCLILKMCY